MNGWFEEAVNIGLPCRCLAASARLRYHGRLHTEAFRLWDASPLLYEQGCVRESKTRGFQQDELPEMHTCTTAQLLQLSLHSLHMPLTDLTR